MANQSNKTKTKKTLFPMTSAELKKRITLEKEHYSIKSLLGINWARYYILLGGRGCGKTYSVLSYFLWCFVNLGKPFIWLRLTEASQRKLLANNASDFIPGALKIKFGLLDIKTKGNAVYCGGKFMCRILALSTFYSDKGVALYDNNQLRGYNIALDEMNRERSEKKTFDINYAFANQLENLVRMDTNVRVFLIGNTLEEASDLMCTFNFIPEKFGRYYIRKRHVVIDYIEPSKKWTAKRKNSVAADWAPNESTFTNKIDIDSSLVYKNRLIKPSYVIRFSEKEAYTVWDKGVIADYNNEKVPNYPMVAYLDLTFSPEFRDAIYERFHCRGFLFKNLLLQKKFKRALELIKPRG